MLAKAKRFALSGATVWTAYANGCYAQFITIDWELELYVRPIVTTSGAGVELVDFDEVKVYAKTYQSYGSGL